METFLYDGMLHGVRETLDLTSTLTGPPKSPMDHMSVSTPPPSKELGEKSPPALGFAGTQLATASLRSELVTLTPPPNIFASTSRLDPIGTPRQKHNAGSQLDTHEADATSLTQAPKNVCTCSNASAGGVPRSLMQFIDIIVER